MRKMLAIVLLTFMSFGCYQIPRTRVVTLEDNNKNIGSNNDWVQVNLRVYPGFQWKFRGVTKPKHIFYLEDCVASQPVRMKGEVPGDPEHDVFHVYSPQDQEVHFTLLNDAKTDWVRDFTFVVMRGK